MLDVVGEERQLLDEIRRIQMERVLSGEKLEGRMLG